jgi:hypothetical protein
MNWTGDRCDYMPWLQERLFPADWEGQALVLWAVYGDGLDLTGEPAQDMAAIRRYLVDQDRLAPTLERKNNIKTERVSVV